MCHSRDEIAVIRAVGHVCCGVDGGLGAARYPGEGEEGASPGKGKKGKKEEDKKGKPSSKLAAKLRE